VSSPSAYERSTLQKRLTQIEHEFTFPNLTDGQRNALDYERLTIMRKLSFGIVSASEHARPQPGGAD